MVQWFACRPAVEVWLPSLSSERASNKEVLSVSSTLGAEPGRGPSFPSSGHVQRSLSPFPSSIWLGIFSKHTNSVVFFTLEQQRAQSNPSSLLLNAVWRAFQSQCGSWLHCIRRQQTLSKTPNSLNVSVVVIGVSVSPVCPPPRCGHSAIIGTRDCVSQCVRLQPHIAFACPCNYLHLCSAFSTPLSHSHPPLPPPVPAT